MFVLTSFAADHSCESVLAYEELTCCSVYLIRILALLQGKTFIETKNRRLKCLKRHYSTVGSMKKGCSVDGGRGICPLFSSPPRGIRQLKSPHPREFAIQGKNANARGSARGGEGGGWAQVELTDALLR